MAALRYYRPFVSSCSPQRFSMRVFSQLLLLLARHVTWSNKLGRFSETTSSSFGFSVNSHGRVFSRVLYSILDFSEYEWCKNTPQLKFFKYSQVRRVSRVNRVLLKVLDTKFLTKHQAKSRTNFPTRYLTRIDSILVDEVHSSGKLTQAWAWTPATHDLIPTVNTQTSVLYKCWSSNWVRKSFLKKWIRRTQKEQKYCDHCNCFRS